MSSRIQNPGPHDCGGVALPMEPSPQSTELILTRAHIGVEKAEKVAWVLYLCSKYTDQIKIVY